jgi:protein TonB
LYHRNSRQDRQEKEASMYADRSMLRRGPQPVSLGASLTLTGAIIAALIFSAPKLVQLPQPGPITATNIPIPPDPPLDPVKQPPKAQHLTEQPIVVPETLIPTHSADPIPTTTNILPMQPPIAPLPTGPAEPVKLAPPPPLIGPDIDPRYARDFQPEYPGSEIREGREGTATVRVHIGTDGHVLAVEQLHATSPAFFEATRRQAISKWRFRPASRGGVAEDSWKVMTVHFVLNNAD